MSTSQLAPAGSSRYSSNSMFVGDGTWDTERNTFLLPNLVGLNFKTMQYNGRQNPDPRNQYNRLTKTGMGNRFRELPQYHLLIRGHGVVAAITFLLIVPSAIFILRFRDRDRRRGVTFHIWLQILTVLLTTVVFVLGWFAVGPKRSLTNPHHGIGLAIYVLVLAQALGGWWIHSRERKKGRIYRSLKAMVRHSFIIHPIHMLMCCKIHHWFGKMIALLGIAQIPLGLTLYGSPVALFVLYTLAVFALFLLYFILSYNRERRGGSEYGSQYSYESENVVNDRRRRSGSGGLFKAAAAGIGLAAITNRLRTRSRSRGDNPEVVGSRVGSRRGSRRHSGSFVEEKYSEYGRDDRREGEGWRDRLFKVGVIAGAIGLVKHFMGRRKDHDRDSDISDYGPPLGGASAINPDNIDDRLEEGRLRPGGQSPSNQPLGHRRSHGSFSSDSYTSAGREGRRGHGLRNTVAGLGAFGFARNMIKNRREKKEQRRLEQQRLREIEDERRARANNQRFTGDGFSRRPGRRSSVTTSTDISTSTDNPRYDSGVPPPIPAGVFPTPVAGTAAAAINRSTDRQHNPLNPSNPAIGHAPPPEPVSMPPIPQDPHGIFHPDSSGSEAYTSAGGRHHRRHSGRSAVAAGVAAGTAAGIAAAEAGSSRRGQHHSGSGGSVASPPVSVKVKMHSDGRHVTLRRLPEEEAAAERRRRSRHGRRRKDSTSSLSDTNGGANRWRRTGTVEQQQQQQPDAMRAESQNLAAVNNQLPIPTQSLPVPLPPPPPPPPPPPIPESSLGPRPGTTGSVGSPGYDVSGTEASAGYAKNRRRRRAERAQKQAWEVRSGNSVEFT